MNNTVMTRMKYIGVLSAFAFILFGTCLCSAQTTSSDETTSDTSTSSSDTGMPLGRKAIDYVLAHHPGEAVRAAANGTPIFQGELFDQPEDEPDFWDNVKTIFLDGLAQAITNVTGISVFSGSTFSSQVGTAGQ